MFIEQFWKSPVLVLCKSQRESCNFKYGNMTVRLSNFNFKKDKERGVGEGTTVYSCYNVRDNRN